FAQLLTEQKDDLAHLMAREMGKVLPEAAGDVQEAIDMCFYMGGEGRRLFGQTTPSELRDKFNMSVRSPIGVIGVITPWNFPNAIIVLEDADLELAVEGILWSAFGTSGQRCTAASRVIVQQGAYEELQSRLVSAAEKLRLGPGWEEGVDVGPVINKGALEKIDSYTTIGKDEGAKLLTGGEVAGGNGLGEGYFYRPTIFGDVDAGMRFVQVEI